MKQPKQERVGFLTDTYSNISRLNRSRGNGLKKKKEICGTQLRIATRYTFRAQNGPISKSFQEKILKALKMVYPVMFGCCSHEKDLCYVAIMT